jgi:ArsR family transcriptional regulator, virulence genes transcriptional regulator
MMSPTSVMCYEHNAHKAETLLALLANRRRLVILCYLLERGEMAVNEIARHVDLSQSALSQHLALMRDSKIVSTRREGTAIFYTLSDKRVLPLIHALVHVFNTIEPQAPVEADTSSL